MLTTPFESLCGGRTFSQFVLDLYRMPDKVEEVMQAMLPGLNDAAIGRCAAVGSPGVWIGGWRSASRMLAQPLWDRFVWPYVKEFVAQTDEAGLIPILHFDSDWTRDLPRLLELPARKCILSLDSMTDIRKAKEILGDHMCIMGDVPPALLSSGTPEQVYEHCIGWSPTSARPATSCSRAATSLSTRRWPTSRRWPTPRRTLNEHGRRAPAARAGALLLRSPR